MASVPQQLQVGWLRHRLSTVWRSLAAIRHPGRSLTGRLMAFVLLTTATALLVAATALLATDLYQDRRAWSEQLESGARILALASAPALSFDDRVAAQRALAALAAQPSIRAAAIYDAHGERIARYTRAGFPPPPLHRPGESAGLHLSGTTGELLQPVVQNGEQLGTVYLLARYQVAGRVITYVEVLALVMLAGLVAAMLTAGWLQRAITSPMDSIAHVARQIVERRTYALRAGKTTHDEFALVVDAFNNMLGEVQLRTQALEQSNQALKEAAAVRQAAEQALLSSERLYRAIGESINYGVWVCDAQGRNSYASDSFLRLTGLTLEGYCQPEWIEVVHPEDRAKVRQAWQECVRSGGLWYHEHRIRDVRGQYHFILAQGVPIRDEQGRIERWAGIHLDIERLKASEQALREADRRKDEFLATLAHELRNPLAPIRNAVFILNSPGANDTQRQRARDVIDRQVHHMSLLLDDLLDVSRVTRGQFGLKREYVDLKTVCEMAIETARPLIQAKQHCLSVQLPEQPLTLEADPLRLAQVISNLLTNAAKYTDAQGRIELEVSLREEELALVVRDNGIGLSAESLPNLFTMFSQVDSSIDRAQGGLGIGLALVKGLVELHGGRVSATSAGLGHGSEFTVRLPRSLVAPAQQPVLPISGVSRAVRLDGPSVMVVDDNRDAAETLSLALSFDGFRVVTAYSGIEALELGARERPQAVVLDVGMPGMDGYETVRRLRAESWGRNSVVVALTGWGQEQDKQDARAAGFDEHLTKPVDLAELTELLTRQLTSRRLAAESRLRALAHG